MNAHTIIADLQMRGILLRVDGDKLHFRAPKGALTPELRGAIEECKAEIVSILKGPSAQSSTDSCSLEDWRNMPLADLEKLNVALEVRTDRNGTIWLVSNAGAKRHVDKPGAVYTAREAMLVLGLPEDVVLQIHRFKERFDATIEAIRPHTEGSGRDAQE